jgi:pyruvate dehydrogenase E1 component alpha subunit
MPGEAVDGMDVLAVREAMRRAVERARTARTPSLLDMACVRLRGHSVVDPDRYRSEDERQALRARDPVPHFAARLREAGLLREADLERLEGEVEAEVQAAVDFADASPEPDPATLFAYSYATPVANQPGTSDA